MDEIADSRAAIKAIALDLLIRHGYRGMSFADIAAAAGITRANVHYHFGSKTKLIDEVLADYVTETLSQLKRIWGPTETRLAEKLSATLAYSRSRYRAFNRKGGKPRPWSLISRLRQDESMLTDVGKAQLRRFTSELHSMFVQAAESAQKAKELTASATPAAIVILLIAIADNAAPITMAGHGFESLEETYAALISLAVKPGASLT